MSAEGDGAAASGSKHPPPPIIDGIEESSKDLATKVYEDNKILHMKVRDLEEENDSLKKQIQTLNMTPAEQLAQYNQTIKDLKGDVQTQLKRYQNFTFDYGALQRTNQRLETTITRLRTEKEEDIAIHLAEKETALLLLAMPKNAEIDRLRMENLEHQNKQDNLVFEFTRQKAAIDAAKAKTLAEKDREIEQLKAREEKLNKIECWIDNCRVCGHPKQKRDLCCLKKRRLL